MIKDKMPTNTQLLQRESPPRPWARWWGGRWRGWCRRRRWGWRGLWARWTGRWSSPSRSLLLATSTFSKLILCNVFFSNIFKDNLLTWPTCRGLLEGWGRQEKIWAGQKVSPVDPLNVKMVQCFNVKVDRYMIWPIAITNRPLKILSYWYKLKLQKGRLETGIVPTLLSCASCIVTQLLGWVELVAFKLQWHHGL